MPKTRSTCFILLAALSISDCPADGPEDSWTFSLYVENDVFANTDQNYTNGTKLSWISPDLSGYRDVEKPQWLQSIVDKLPYIHDQGLQRNVTISLGQNMYTPQEIWRSDFIEDDRPYGGWLYMGYGFHSKSSRELDSWEINLGVVGPYSWASDVQKAVHQVIDSPRPKGWHHQIDTEIGINFVYLNKQRSIHVGNREGWAFELFSHYGGSIGNVATYLNGGFEGRAGWRLPSDFGSGLIRMGQDTSAPTSFADPAFDQGFKSLGFAVFSAVDGRFVARDIFLDGNTFKDSHSLEKEQWVADATLGISIVAKRWKLSYTQVFRSKQYKIQGDEHTFGSINLSLTY